MENRVHSDSGPLAFVKAPDLQADVYPRPWARYDSREGNGSDDMVSGRFPSANRDGTGSGASSGMGLGGNDQASQPLCAQGGINAPVNASRQPLSDLAHFIYNNFGSRGFRSR